MGSSASKSISGLPLPALLSQLLVAFTIECDNEFEHQMAQWEASLRSHGERARKLWTVSLAMWSNYMRFLGNDPIPVRQLEYQAHMSNMAGMERWGYITVTSDPADTRAKPPRSDWLVQPTRGGLQAQSIWSTLIADVETRWQLRFGKDIIDSLREALQSVNAQLKLDLPEFLPVLRYGLYSHLPQCKAQQLVPAYNSDISPFQLPTLLSKVLLAFAMEFERESNVSLAICENVMRFLDADDDLEGGARVRDLPRLSGVSKEAISMGVGYLVRHGYASFGPDLTVAGVKWVRLNARGVAAKEKYELTFNGVINEWQVKYGTESIGRLRESCEALYLHSDVEGPTLSAGLRPDPDGWRARKPYLAQTAEVLNDPAGNLPHFPMVLHRGGYPDGS